MAVAITAQYLDPQATQARIRAVHVDYDDDENNAGGFVLMQYLDASNNVVEQEKIRFTAAQFAAWNGTASQARTFGVNNSARLA